MNTTFLTVAVLSSALATGQAPSWQSNYFQAQATGAAQKKPLTIVFAAGPNNAAKVATEGKLNPQVAQLLTEKYLPVFVDTSTVAGAKLAQTFEIRDGVGMVIGDRTGNLQAFWHQGQLSNESMARYLQKYADAQTVSGTETATQSRTSFYPSAPVSGAMGAAFGSGIGSSFSGVDSGSSYCPTCQGGGGRSRR